MSDERLRRERAGLYRTADGRFEVRQESGAWFVTDLQTENELGQPMLLGPYPSLDASRAGIDELREGARRPPPTRRPAAKRAAQPKPPPPPPPSWIDELPSGERARVRRAIAELERRGIRDPEETVRADVEGLLPAVARRLILAGIDGIVAGQDDERAARSVAGAVVDLLTGQRDPDGDLPGWELVETNGRHGKAPIRLTAEDVARR